MLNHNAFVYYFQVYLEEVEHLIGKEGGPFLIDDMRVNTNSWSLRVLKKKGFRCVACSLEGTLCWVQKQKKNVEIPTLVVYGVKEGKQVPLTVDHIVATADGGTNGLHNLQCLCVVCNGVKSSKAAKERHSCCGWSLKSKNAWHSKDCTHGHFLRHRWNEISRWTLG